MCLQATIRKSTLSILDSSSCASTSVWPHHMHQDLPSPAYRRERIFQSLSLAVSFTEPCVFLFLVLDSTLTGKKAFKQTLDKLMSGTSIDVKQAQQEAAADPAFLAGMTLEQNYHVEELIGEGGMAHVYRATHRILQGNVAVKVLQRRYAQRSDFRERFLREARLQYQIQHPHIVRVLDFIEDRDLVGCVLEWCNGGELIPEKYSPTKALPLLQIEDNFLPLLDALGEVHGQGYVHRDIKPQNILIQKQKDKVLWKIGDFGLLKDPDAEDITQSGAIIGTFHYISPEQFQESKKVDCRTDIYSLGVVLYQLLLGRVPFPSRMPRLAVQILEAPVPFPAHFPQPLRDVLTKALAKRPEERYPQCQEFKEALQQAIVQLKTPSETLPLTKPLSEPKPTRQTTTLPTQQLVADERDKAVLLQTPLSSTPPAHSSNRGSSPSKTINATRETAEAPPQRATTLRKLRYPLVVLLLVVLVVAAWLRFDPGASLQQPSKTQAQQKPRQNKLVGTLAKSALAHRRLSVEGYLKEAVWWAQKGNWGSTRYYLKLSCRDRPMSCYWYAVWLHNTIELWRKTCKAGDKTGCHWSAVATRKRWKKDRFFKRALPFFQKACRHGEPRACVVLGTSQGAHRQLSPTEQIRWLRRACELKYSQGCLALGSFYKKSRKPRHKQLALAQFQKACELHEPKGCLLWGQAVNQPKATRAHREQALYAFRKACQLHDQRGCRWQQSLTLSTP